MRLRLSLRFPQGLLVGGQTAALLVDVTTAREPGGAPMIPASAVKGALRIVFERLLAGLERKVCHPSTPEWACQPPDLCLACQLFGNPAQEGLLRFHDARIEGEMRHLFTRRERADEPEQPTGMGYALRPGVAISRRQRVAEEELLFFSETVAPMSLTFTSMIEVLGPLPNPPGQEETIRLLRAASRSLNALGADKSRGLGHLEADLEVEEFPGLGAVGSQTSPSVPQGADVILTLMPEEYVRISGVKVANNFMESLDFLPGSAVKGAIARSFVHERKQGNWQDPEVRLALFQKPVVISNFYPTTGAQARPLPLSARTCKRYPGLIYKRERRAESHGAKDILIAAALVKLLREKGAPIVLQDRCQVSGCGGPLKLLEGFMIQLAMTALSERGLRPSRRTMTKTAIDRSRFTSAEGQLYTYEVLDSQLEEPEEGRLRFVGTIRGLSDELKAHLAPGRVLFIGGARGRGFGKVRVAGMEPLYEEEPKSLRNRLDRFTAAIQKSLRPWGHPKKDSLFFAFTLLSDLIPPLVRDWKGWLVQEIAQRLSLEKDKLALEKAFTRVVYRGGFNVAVGLRKDLLPALAMGSAFVFSYSEDGKEIREALIQGVQVLLRTGLGLRREEGYGQVSFCDAFHLGRQQQDGPTTDGGDIE